MYVVKVKDTRYKYSSQMQKKNWINLPWQVESKISKSKVNLFKKPK
jgi:hypothetical protein